MFEDYDGMYKDNFNINNNSIGNDPAVGVHIVRQNTGSSLYLEKQHAVQVMLDRCGGSLNAPATESEWEHFVYNFFPGWSIYSYIE